MTALMGLRTRLALAGVALQVPADRRDADVIASVIAAGVDLIICDFSGDVDADVDFLRALRRQFSGRALLVATASQKVAVPAAADVVHLRRPGWCFWGYPRGHEWGLLGRDATETAVVETPGDDFDYLIVPVSGPADPLLGSALTLHPPLTVDALPWFAQLQRVGAEDDAGITQLLTSGVRRIALPGDILDCSDMAERVTGIVEALKGSWAADDRTEDHRRRAWRL